MDVYEIRRGRLEELFEAGKKPSEIASKTKIAASTISRYRLAPDKNGAKNISEENARKIEEAFHKPKYWLDGEAAPRASAPPAPPDASAMQVRLPPVVEALETIGRALEAEMASDRRDAIELHLGLLAKHRGSKLHVGILIGLMSPQLVDQERGKPALNVTPPPLADPPPASTPSPGAKARSGS